MKLVFIYGPPAAGKYTIAKLLADRTGYALFHNHLIVDAVAAVFPFGSPDFVRLREQFWCDTIGAAVADDRSLIFTFQPEASVSRGFPEKIRGIVEAGGGDVIFISLKLAADGQLARIANADRAQFGKLRSADLLRTLQPQFEDCEAAMPAAHLTLDTAETPAARAAELIADLIRDS